MLTVVENEELVRDERFDCVLALEVLEHIEDDVAALRRWVSWLKPSGHLLLSVPAHMSKWTPADELGGHWRRYERSELRERLQAGGLSVLTVWSYGFPVTAVTVPLRRILYRSREMKASRVERTLESSFDSVRHVAFGGKAVSVAAEALGAVCHLLQLPFRSLDLGDGYFAHCVLPVAGQVPSSDGQGVTQLPPGTSGRTQT
jgi:SAM-dependent methyltransferase